MLFSSFLIVLCASAVFAGPCDNWSGTNPVYYLEGSTCKVYACAREGVIGTTVGTADISNCTGSSSSGGSSSCTVGAKENKYTASGCSYTTQTRTCCNDKTWSGWGEACSGASNCTSSQCWNSSTSSCQSKPRSICSCSNGTCSRTYSCGSSGWTYTDTCTCKSGYEKNSSGKCVEKCKSGSRTIDTIQQNCASATDSVTCATTVFNSAKMAAKTITANGACTSAKTSGCYAAINSSEAWDTKYPPTGGYTTHVSVACYSSTCVLTGNYVCPE